MIKYKGKLYKLYNFSESIYSCPNCAFYYDDGNKGCEIINNKEEKRLEDCNKENDLLNLCEHGANSFKEIEVFERKELRFVR